MSMNGTLPSSLANLTALTILDLEANYLHGTIPASLGELSQLVVLEMSYNQLTGELPAELCGLTQLEALALGSNRLRGAIPSSLSTLGALKALDLSENAFSGTIPSFLGSFVHLKLLVLELNALRGPIPNSLGALSELVLLSVYKNKLTGTIPASLGNLWQVQLLDVGDNKLTGTVPAALGQLPQLAEFEANRNRLNGTIPASFGNATSLVVLYWHSNRLTGTIPAELGRLSALSTLSLHNNLLSGALPPSLGELPALEMLSLYVNALSGEIPASLVAAATHTLQYLYLDDNLLSGEIPASLGALPYVLAASYSANLLTGTLPSSFAGLAALQYLEIDHNALSGAVPAVLADIAQLMLLEVSHNQLSGSLCFANTTSRRLQLLAADSNFFSGRLPPLGEQALLQQFSASDNLLSGPLPAPSSNASFAALKDLQLSSNALTGALPDGLLRESLQILYVDHNLLSGEIPAAWFDRGSALVAVVMAINCLSGTIPSSICRSDALVQIALDGLRSAKACERRVFSLYGASGIVVPNAVRGAIPPCLFQKPLMQDLQLSGNAITGAIPPVNMSMLAKLVLSNNLLTGAVPPALWYQRSLSYLDLSFNRLRDVIPRSAFANTAPNATVNVEVNQLSGAVPPALLRLENVNLLRGNLFACNAARSDIPSSDPHFKSYNCGSDLTNASLLFYAALLAALLLAGALLWAAGRVSRSLWDAASDWLATYRAVLATAARKEGEGEGEGEDERARTGLQEVEEVLWMVQRVAGFAVLVSLLLFLPLYSALSASESSYVHTYIWVVSAPYLQGLSSSAALLCVFWLVVLVVSRLMPVATWGRRDDNAAAKASTAARPSDASHWAPLLARCSAALAPSRGKAAKALRYAVMLLANAAVVLSMNALYVTAVVQGRFDTRTLEVFAFLLSIFKVAWNHVVILAASHQRNWPELWQVHCGAPSLMMLAIFNNLVVPYIAEALISTKCLLYAVERAPEVEVTYFQAYCYGQYTCAPTADSFCTLDIQCPLSSKLLDSSGEDEIVTQYTPPFHYSFQCSSRLISTFASVFVYRSLICGVVQPLVFIALKRLQLFASRSGRSALLRCTALTLPTLWKADASYGDETRSLEHMERTAQSIAGGVVYLQLSVYLVTDFAIMLSVGVLFPPLIPLVAFSMAKEIFQFRMLVGRWKKAIDEQPNETLRAMSEKNLELLGEKMRGFRDVVVKGIWMSLVVAVMFWSFSLFDALGLAEGAASASWIVAAMMVSPWILSTAKYYQHNSHLIVVSTAASSAPSFELRDIQPPVEVDGEELRLTLNPLFNHPKKNPTVYE